MAPVCYPDGFFGVTTTLITAAESADTGAAWLGSPVTLGYGPVTQHVVIGAQRSALYSTIPGTGWALVIANDTGSNLGNSGDDLGVPRTRRGMAVEWRFNSSSTVEADRVLVRRLTGTSPGEPTGSVSVTPSVDSTDTGADFINLYVRYTPANPLFGVTAKLEVWDSADLSAVPRLTTTNVPPEWVPGTQLRIGVTAASSSTQRSDVFWVQTSDFIVREGLCI
jgi:hypothetical protein